MKNKTSHTYLGRRNQTPVPYNPPGGNNPYSLTKITRPQLPGFPGLPQGAYYAGSRTLGYAKPLAVAASSAATSAASASWFSKTLKGIGRFGSKGLRFFGSPWFLVGLTLYDIVSSWSGSDDDKRSLEASLAASSGMLISNNLLITPAMRHALTLDLADSNSIARAYLRAGSALSQSDDPDDVTRAAFYILLSSYLRVAPNANSSLFSPAQSAALLKDLSAALGEGMDQEAKNEMTETTFDEEAIATMPAFLRRQADFMSYYVQQHQMQAAPEA